jgi:hypothetical protein
MPMIFFIGVSSLVFTAFTIIASTQISIIMVAVKTFPTVTITTTICAFTHYFCQLKNQLRNLFHIFLIIFFLHIVEELIGVFSFPFHIVFHIPFTRLNFPIKRNFIFNGEGWNTPYNPIVGLCCIISIL